MMDKILDSILESHSNQKSEVDGGVYEFFNNNKKLVVIFTGHRQILGSLNIENTIKMFQKKKFDIIFLKDSKKSWYHLGLPPLGKTINEIVSNLKNRSRSYEKVLTIGSSMGGYAAILIGNLINANFCISFSANSTLDKEIRKKIGDIDRHGDKDLVCQKTSTPQYLDLKNYFEEHSDDSKTCCINFCGEFNKKDMAHATRLLKLDNFHLLTNKTSKHSIKASLVKNILEIMVTKIVEDISTQELIQFLKNEEGFNYYQKFSKF